MKSRDRGKERLKRKPKKAGKKSSLNNLFREMDKKKGNS